MKVEFVLRTPGQHQTLPIVELECVPRSSEWVILNHDDAGYEVHSVTHDVSRGVVIVLLRI